MRRYSRNKVLVDWEILNEPQAHSTETNDLTAFRNFLTDIVARVHASDPSTPLSLGSIGTGQAGFSNGDYAQTLKIAGVGMATAHDYNNPNDALPVSPACNSNCIRADIATARTLARPIFIGDAGDDNTGDGSAVTTQNDKEDANR